MVARRSGWTYNTEKETKCPQWLINLCSETAPLTKAWVSLDSGQCGSVLQLTSPRASPQDSIRQDNEMQLLAPFLIHVMNLC